MKMANCAATIQGWQLLEGGVCLKIYGILKWYIYNISGGRCSSVTVHVYTSLSDWSLPEFDVIGCQLMARGHHMYMVPVL